MGCAMRLFQPASPALRRRPRDGRHSPRGEDIRSNRAQPGTAAREKGRSSVALIYSFAASKEENTVKKSKLLMEPELCQVPSDDGCF